MTGALIDCSSTSTLLCSNTLDFVQEFYIRCGNQPCTNIITNSAKKVMTYDATTETQYSIIWCSLTCTNTLTTVSQVFIYCATPGSKCTNSFTSVALINPDANFPYVYCRGLTAGSLCKNTFSYFYQVSVDC